MTFAILSSFILSIFILFIGKYLRSSAFKWLSLFPFSLFLFFSTFIQGLESGDYWFRNSWIPQLGISFDFKLDGLSSLFALLITGIGTLVYFYAASYLKGHEYINRFFCYLSIFMGSMLGLVLSDNILTMFIFWELTSISSFFLIGFDNNNEESRKSALLALGVTGLGGFFLMAGAICLGNISGTYSLYEMLNSSYDIKSSPLYPLIAIFIFGGAFTKSAQFPFHFWLPGAMKAPTPVSAYLHSATMVKAGIYLLARLTPILGDTPVWNHTLMIVGGITMVYAAIHSLFRIDLKSILAYSTIAALGMMVFLLGIGSNQAIQAVATFILIHALYKAALFMITGTIDHSVHTRNITQLSGLQKIMPVLGIAGVLAALSNAGIPLTFGFIGKDLIYESTLHTTGWFPLILTGVAFLTNILLMYAGFLAGIKPFTGAYTEQYKRLHLPTPSLYVPPLILGIIGIVFGLFPLLAQEMILRKAANTIAGIDVDMHLKIWHGFNLVLGLSAATIISGGILYFIRKPKTSSVTFIDQFDQYSPKYLVQKFIGSFKSFAYGYTKIMHNGYLRIYILAIVFFTTALVGYRLFASVPLQVNTEGLSEFRIYELVVFLIMVVATVMTVATHSRLTAIACLSIIGYCICLIFVFYGAPDLAMTQFTIDTLTVVLFVLVLFKLPSYIKKSRRPIQIRDGLISAAFGTLIALITLQALVHPANKEISKFYAENAYLLAKGKNVVNVILVDFRGFDTLVETIVLSIAAIGVYGLLKYRTAESKIE